MLRRNKVVFLVALIVSVTLSVNHVALASPTPPVASFTYTPTAPILGQVVIFNASSSYDPDGGNISSYKWNFDDGTIITIPDPVAYHNYTTFRTYNVTLAVTDTQNEKGATWHTVTVREYPVASFTYTPERPIVGQTATFNASSSTPNGGTIIRYDWNFGDGNTANVTVPITTHIYANEGNYQVTLIVRDSEGLSDTCSKPITVIDYPVAAFTHTPERPLVNQTVTFDASSSTSDGGTIISYNWNFGDSATGTGKIVTHQYATFGNYNVTLTVTDSEGLTDLAWHVVTVRKLPFATFTYSPATPLVGETVTFNASLSTPDGGTIVSYKWNFGDGSPLVTEVDPITNHTYTAYGTFIVTLTITDSEDLTDDFSTTIRILIAPTADFTFSPTKPIINQLVTFNASASSDPDRSIVSYRWNFGDGSLPVTEADPITNHTYTAEGTYNVTLTVTDDDGLTDTVWKLITVYTFLYVHDVAIKSITISATEVYVGQMINITVVAKNEGTSVETFSVTAYCGAISLGTQPVTNLLPGAETTLKFSWNTVGVAPGDYVVSAQASAVPGETDTADNTFTNGTVKVKMTGDVNGDRIVDIGDVVYVAIHFGAEKGKPPLPGVQPYEAKADLNSDDIIDITDIVIIAIHFGEAL